MVFGGNIGSWDPVLSFSPLLGASSGEAWRAACSSLSQTVCAPRFRCSVKGFVVPRRARFAEYSPCHHVCRISHRRRRNESSVLSPRWSTEHAPMAPLVARSPSAPCDASVERWMGRDLRGQHLDPLGSPPCSRDADESFRVLSSVSPRDEQGRKSSCRIEAGPHAPDDSSKASHPQSTLVTHRGSCWPDVLRRYPHDVAVTCIPWRAPLVAEAPKSISSHHPCKHGWCASVDSRLPMGIDSGARSSGPLSPKTWGKLETVTMWPRLAAGLPSLPPDAISAGAIRPALGPLVRVTIHDWRGP